MELSDLIDAILDQTSDNELTLKFKRTTDGTKLIVVIKDTLSDIGYALDDTTSGALKEMQNQMQAFVEDLDN